MSPVSPSRRHLLKLAGGLGVGMAASAPLTACARPSGVVPSANPVVARVLTLSDLHSAYERTAQLLAAFEREVRSHPVPHVIALNGDIFEQGNVVSVRSQGAIDWAFLAALPRLAPTVVNLGNHDNDLINDLAEVVARLRALGIQVVTHLHDRRTDRPYAEPMIELPLGDRRLRIVGLGTDALHTYPRDGRELLSIPAPQDWARDTMARYLQGSDLRLVMCHTGVAQERLILPHVPPASVMVGGHNHLLFTEHLNGVAYAHSGSWNNAYTVAEYTASGEARVRNEALSVESPADPALAALIATTLATHLTETERQVLGQMPSTLSLGETGRAVALGIARAAGAEMGFIGHTTLGTGVQAGPLTRFAYDAVVRFDGKVMKAEVTPDQLAIISARVNQDRPTRLDDRTGDFLYASPAPDSGKTTITIATNDWCARNQHEYFGTDDIVFSEVPGPGIKAIGLDALLGR